MPENLKSCPFCGGDELHTESYLSGYVVVCGDMDCQAEGPLALRESGAIAKWNERALAPEVQALVEAITGHEDRSLWWIEYVRTLVQEYKNGHNWIEDDDPDATDDAIRSIRRGTDAIVAALAALEVNDQ